MDVTSQHAARHSERDFATKLATYVDSGAGIIHVRTHEVTRAAQAVRKQAVADGATVKEWDVVAGFRSYSVNNIGSSLVDGDGNVDFLAALNEPLQSLRGHASDHGGPEYFVYVNPHPFIDSNPMATQLLLTYGHILPSTEVVVVLVTPDIPLPSEADPNILSLYFDTPGLAELKDSLNQIVGSVSGDIGDGLRLSEEDIDRICYVGAGMTLAHFEMYSALAIVGAARESKDSVTADDIAAGVSVGKTEVVNSTDILELYQTTDMSNVGGLDNLKRWVRNRKGCYSDEAKAFGIQPPKGIVLVGVPGSGKSLIGKSIAKELGVPLVRLDMGRVFNSLVGASEQRMRTALKQVESMSPVCMLVDEIDKGLGGIGGGGDSGVSSRVLGTLLTWLQDSEYPVFTIATANNVTGLPPEMLRRGRFDAIFSTSLPTDQERKEVLAIHLKLRGRDIKDYGKSEVAKVVSASNGYVPAEIESAVKDALINAYTEGVDLTMQHVVDALHSMVPLSKAFAAQVKAMQDWAATNATPAGYDPLQSIASKESVVQAGTRRITSTRARR